MVSNVLYVPVLNGDLLTCIVPDPTPANCVSENLRERDRERERETEREREQISSHIWFNELSLSSVTVHSALKSYTFTVSYIHTGHTLLLFTHV